MTAPSPSKLSPGHAPERWQLLTAHMRRIERLAQKMAFGPVSGSELYSASMVELSEQLHQYDPARGAFMTWAFQRVRLSRLRLLRESRKHDRPPYGAVSFDGSEDDEDMPVVQLATPEGASGHADRMAAAIDVERALQRADDYSRSAVLITLCDLPQSLHPARRGTSKRKRSYEREIRRDLDLLLSGREERQAVAARKAAEAAEEAEATSQLALL